MSFIKKFNSQLRAAQHNTVDPKIKDIIKGISNAQHECSLLALGKCEECNAYLAMRYGNVTIITDKNLEFDYQKEFNSVQNVAATVTTSLAVSTPTTPTCESVLNISVSDIHSRSTIKLNLPVTKEGYVRSLSPHTCDPCPKDHHPAHCEKAHLDEHECKPCDLKHLSDHQCKACKLKHLSDHSCPPCNEAHLSSHKCATCTEPHLSTHKCPPCRRKHLEHHTCPSMPCDREHLDDHQCTQCTKDHIPDDALSYMEKPTPRLRTDTSSLTVHTMPSQAITSASYTESTRTIRPDKDLSTDDLDAETPSDEEDDLNLDPFTVSESADASSRLSNVKPSASHPSKAALELIPRSVTMSEKERERRHHRHRSEKSHRSRAPSPTPTVATSASKLSPNRTKPSALATFFGASPPPKKSKGSSHRTKNDEEKQ